MTKNKTKKPKKINKTKTHTQRHSSVLHKIMKAQ